MTGRRTRCGIGAFVAVLGIGCDEPQDDAEVEADAVEFAGSASVVSGAAFSGSYKMYCVTFADPPAAMFDDLGEDGSFSLEVPSNTSFGCFINDENNVPACVIRVVDDTSTGLSGESAQANTISLSGDVELESEIQCDPASGVATIPLSELQSSMGETTEFDLSAVHDRTFEMDCLQATGFDQEGDLCAMIDETGNPVFFRILEGTYDGDPVTAMGVWGAETDFTGCDSIDVDPVRMGLAGDLVLSQGNEGTWTFDDTCPQGYADESSRLRPMGLYALELLTNVGGMWNMTDTYSGDYESCSWRQTMSVAFGPGDDRFAMIGNFQLEFVDTCSDMNMSGSVVIGFYEP